MDSLDEKFENLKRESANLQQTMASLNLTALNVITNRPSAVSVSNEVIQEQTRVVTRELEANAFAASGMDLYQFSTRKLFVTSGPSTGGAIGLIVMVALLFKGYVLIDAICKLLGIQ